MKKETGGPAFPVAHWDNHRMAYVDTGMTLRDYFAAKAMEGLIVRDRFLVGMSQPHWTKQAADDAYRMAYAMMEARK